MLVLMYYVLIAYWVELDKTILVKNKKNVHN